MSINIRHTRHSIPLLMALTAAMVACTSDSDPKPEPLPALSQEGMTFEVTTGTRVVATTDTNIVEKPFMLFGDFTYNNSELKTLFDWHSVEYNMKDETNKFWDYGQATQYWYMGQEHSFVAIHPFIEKGDSQVTVLTYENNELSFTYELPEKMENACDLLFATHRRKYTLDNQGPVRLQFRHLLARINISLALVEKDLMYDHVDEKDYIDRDALPDDMNMMVNEYIKVHSIEFNGIKTKASFSFYPKKLNGVNSTYDYEKKYFISDDYDIADLEKIEKKTVTLENPNPVYNSYKRKPGAPEPGTSPGEGTDNGTGEGAENGAADQPGDQPGDQTGSDTEEENWYTIEYYLALTEQEVIVMLPQEFDEDSEATMVVNYSINDDKDLMRRIVIPLKNTEWKEGVSYTYKFLIDNAYYEHVKDGKIEVDIDDFRLPEESDHYWITDDEDRTHNIKYGFDEKGNFVPVN